MTTPTTAVTRLIPTGGADAVIPSARRHSRRRFGSPPTTSSGGDPWPPVVLRASCSHRGAIQDALGGILPTVLRAGNKPPTPSHPHFASLGRHPRPAPSNKPPVPPGAHVAQRGLSRNNGESFWRRATLASHAQSYFAAIVARCSRREPTLDTRASTGCGGLGKISTNTTEDRVDLV